MSYRKPECNFSKHHKLFLSCCDNEPSSLGDSTLEDGFVDWVNGLEIQTGTAKKLAYATFAACLRRQGGLHNSKNGPLFWNGDQ